MEMKVLIYGFHLSVALAAYAEGITKTIRLLSGSFNEIIRHFYLELH